jgi:hypothetical protein
MLRYVLRMHITSKAAGFALVIAAALALTGCVQQSPHVIPTSEPSVAPVFKSNAAALAAAKKAYVAYLAVSDQILIDGGKDPQRLLSVATQAELKTQMAGFDEAKSRNWHSTGKTTIDDISLQGYFPGHNTGIIVVYACIDVTAVDVLGSSGSSVVSPSRPAKATFQTTFDLASHSPKKLLLAQEVPWQGESICS